MFRGFRRSVKPIIWIVAIGFVGSIFLMQYSFQGHLPRVARVNGQELSKVRFDVLCRGQIDLYRSIFRENFNESMIVGIRKRLLEELIREKILLIEAERIGIKAKPEEVMEEIRRPFLDKDGNFDAKRFNEYLDRMTKIWPNFPQIMEEEARANLVVERLVNLIRDMVKVTDLEVRDYYNKITTEPNEKDFETRKADLKKTLLTQKTQQVFEEWYNSLKEKAKIELNPDFKGLID